MLLALIIGCEIVFWVLLVLGLVARYVVHMSRLGALLLLCVPLIDIVLLVATVIDLHGGASANFAHGLAAVYLGFTVVFGPGMIRWADQHFARKFAGGPLPWKPPVSGWLYARYEWLMWGKGMLACLIASLLIQAAIFMVGDTAKTGELTAWFRVLGGLMIIWLIAWPLWYTVFPKRETAGTIDAGEK
ncbi:MAG: hypothetical protein COB37_08865 [Kordiimonadales bacterium]|nr:MAG: hypothetical protein COB37_08865 [Kordiimonadales bacterium]